jgi:RNA polymerase sigma-70 factor (ECF subfamily)
MGEPQVRKEGAAPGGGSFSGPALSVVQEESLRNRIAARDERALSELVDVAGPWLLGVAHAMLRDVAEAEDVVMEAFRITWNSIQPVSGESRAILPYLLRVTRHRAIDRIRSRQRRQRNLALIGAVEDRPTVAPTEPNEAAQPGWHLHRQVHAALAELPEEQRTAVRLAYFEGLSQSEIAEALGIPLGTVKTRLRLAFGRLRTALAHVRDWVL